MEQNRVDEKVADRKKQNNELKDPSVHQICDHFSGSMIVGRLGH